MFVALDACPNLQGVMERAERAIELISETLPTAIRTPDNLSARTQMAMGALQEEMAMSNTGLHTVHALTYPGSALTQASHGACNGVLLPAVLDFVEPVRKPQMQGSLAGVGLDRLEKEAIRQTLAMTQGNREQAAQLLGIGERTLYRKLKEYGLK